ncbi:unnamed protein product [Symbiodinium pilosum]|uniref:Uncharacterized protein n=1 Tax=Symbiodinium pilosum TaxID=2952 RepID=A0A812SLE9_SYMPI|nr:unnamed protein product [Symbiodinium pilosum]
MAEDLHKPYSSYCGTSGALSSLDFGQLFAGDAATGKTTCKFAPLVRFGDFMDTGIVRQKTTTNWPDWNHLLAENYVECAEGEGLTAFKLEAGRNLYRPMANSSGGLGSCFDYYSAQVEIASFGQSINNWAKPIRMMHVSCGQNAVLGSFHFEFSEGGKWGRVRYQCCKAGGAPVSFDPRGQLAELVSRHEGVFCPTSRDHLTGRVKFEGGNGHQLSFQRESGKWCIGTYCSDVTNSATPLGIKGAPFEVVNVSDFDGEFLGQMPKEESKALSLAEALRMKPPRRPPQPKMPELAEFKAEQPKYAAECLNYENLWKDVTETFKDEEDEEVQTTSKLEADPATKDKDMVSYHPCEVAKGAGGIFGPWGKGDGSTAPENMMYADWNDCMQGDIERDLAAAQLDYHGALTDFIMDLTEETMGAVCGVIPDVMIAPFGAGVALNPGEICNGISELIGAISNFAGPISGFHFAKQGWSIEQEGYAACNPMQVGFARAFCDIHCVRDAVIRGDRSIIRNLELATKKTNLNMQALVKWSVESARVDIGWIGDKLDYMHAINTAYLQEIHNMVTQQSQADKDSLLQSAKAATDAMFVELAGYAQAASADELSRITAKRALDDFLKTPDLPSWKSANATAAASLFARLENLHQTLQRVGHGRDKGEMISRQVARSVRHLQRQASFQLRTLGVYRQESNASHHAARSSQSSASLARERHEILVALDHIWWQLRTKLDSYLDVAEDEVQAFQNSLTELRSFLDCNKGFSDLAAGYAANMASLRHSHHSLRTTWRQGTNLLGELAAVLTDSEAFKTFVAEQGCQSGLMRQTLQQLQSAIFGMAFLLHRFRVAHLAEPDTSVIKQTTKRIQEAYAAATAQCQ